MLINLSLTAVNLTFWSLVFYEEHEIIFSHTYLKPTSSSALISSCFLARAPINRQRMDQTVHHVRS